MLWFLSKEALLRATEAGNGSASPMGILDPGRKGLRGASEKVRLRSVATVT